MLLSEEYQQLSDIIARIRKLEKESKVILSGNLDAETKLENLCIIFRDNSVDITNKYIDLSLDPYNLCVSDNIEDTEMFTHINTMSECYELVTTMNNIMVIMISEDLSDDDKIKKISRHFF